MSLPRRRHQLIALMAVIAVECAIAIALTGPSWAPILVAAFVVFLVASAGAPWLIPVSVVPGVWLLMRAGGGSLDMSLSDVVLVAGTATALRLVPWHEVRVRRGLLAVVTYVGLMLIPVAAHWSERAGIELLHRAVLLGGSIAVGAAITTAGRTTMSLRLFVGASTLFGAAAVIEALRSGFEPAYPFGLQKNAAGGLLAMTIVILLLAPSLVQLHPSVRIAVLITLLAGLAATQSRGASIALIAVMAVSTVQRDRSKGLRVAAVLSAAVAVLLVVTTFDDLGVEDTNNRFNSFNSRRLTNEYALDRWEESPLTGIGIRFFRDPDFYERAAAEGRSTFGEPHNVAIVNLAEGGIVGTTALIVLLGWLVALLRRYRTPLASLASMLLLTRLVNTQFDIWWVAGTLTLPFVVIGMALAEKTPVSSDAVPASSSRTLVAS